MVKDWLMNSWSVLFYRRLESELLRKKQTLEEVIRGDRDLKYL